MRLNTPNIGQDGGIVPNCIEKCGKSKKNDMKNNPVVPKPEIEKRFKRKLKPENTANGNSKKLENTYKQAPRLIEQHLHLTLDIGQ